ncbi:MAG: carbon-nitrogen hydrolase family protein [Gemmatimonadaceae bacterium]|nr:carbon-nitrogen hydrolase family protein [Gemmatimonadaceae bacterium]
MLERLRVASLQYLIRPVTSFDAFRDQVVGLVETAAEYKCQLIVFPEYFTVQLLTLGDVRRPIHEQIRTLAGECDRFVAMMQELATRFNIYIVAGTIPFLDAPSDTIRNHSYFCSPRGDVGVQGKLTPTRFEREEWLVTNSRTLRIFETDFGRLAIAICYDVEFPEVARAAARLGANILIVPSCTDDRQGFLRVRYCAHARAIENQMYVIHSGTVGSLPMVPAVSLNYGQAAILTPNDFPFARDGIAAEGHPNQEMMVIGELNLRTVVESRESGTVIPLLDSQFVLQSIDSPEVVIL